MAFLNLRYFRDDFQVSTWLLIGACLQICLVLLLPRIAALLPAILLLVWRVSYFVLARAKIIYDPSLMHVRLGRYSAQIPLEDGRLPTIPSSDELVVFILGARSNHIDGRFAPGFRETGDMFGDMWRELNVHRNEWGYLGKTSTLFATDEDCGNSMLWISYWRDLESLQKWANGTLHRKAQGIYEGKKIAHIGIMHETYHVPKNHWEVIYRNFKPIGLGQIKTFRASGMASKGRSGTLFEADGPPWRSMTSRMGRGSSNRPGRD